jgi:hypothetical protein
MYSLDVLYTSKIRSSLTTFSKSNTFEIIYFWPWQDDSLYNTQKYIAKD